MKKQEKRLALSGLKDDQMRRVAAGDDGATPPHPGVKLNTTDADEYPHPPIPMSLPSDPIPLGG